MRNLFFLCAACFLFACTKSKQEPVDTTLGKVSGKGKPVTTSFTTYIIAQGAHYCTPNTIRSISTSEMKFIARFDNSAIYQTQIPDNQYDINKLWGFSEGFDHQYNSARIGWSWNDGALRLYAYAYNKGVRESIEITPVTIGQDIKCSIKLSGANYLFTVNGISVTLPRGTTGTKANGFQLYPYFGGDETAPHAITIQIRSI